MSTLTCAVGPCQTPRPEGSMYCAKHGPAKGFETKVYKPHVPKAPKKASPLGKLADRLVAADALLVCPHCQTAGQVHTRVVRQKAGISGGKATAGVFTGGLSLLGTGLSRKQRVTKAKCGNCKVTWHIA